MTNWFPSVLWHCWFGHLACKNRRQNDLLCVKWDVKPYTLTHTVNWVALNLKKTCSGSPRSSHLGLMQRKLKNWKSRSFKQKVKVLSTYFRGILKLLRAVLWWVGIKIKRVCVCVCLCLLVKSPNAEFDTDMLKVTVLCVLACCVLKIWFHIGILWYIFASVSPVWAPGL